MATGMDRIMNDSPEATETTERPLARGEHPLAVGGLQSAIRIGLTVAALGVVVLLAKPVLGDNDFPIIAGLSLIALGLGGAGLLQILFRA